MPPGSEPIGGSTRFHINPVSLGRRLMLEATYPLRPAVGAEQHAAEADHGPGPVVEAHLPPGRRPP
jgi:hypothetical protein